MEKNSIVKGAQALLVQGLGTLLGSGVKHALAWAWQGW